MRTIGVAVIGAGYWGPNLIRNLGANPAFDLRWVCDLDIDRARAAVGRRSSVGITDALDDVLGDDRTQAVVIATPVATHSEVARACLDAGRHVMVEKPLAMSVAEGEKLVDTADREGLVLMCDHTYCYTPAVRWIREAVASGELGDLQYIDSVRINLGLVQSDVDVFWDLGPHDLSILDFIVGGDLAVERVSAHGADPIGAGLSCMGYLTLRLAGGLIAHAHVNWLSPTKIRTTIIGGARRIAVWDDLHPTQRLSVYDKGVELNGSLDRAARRDRLVSYRVGDMLAPALPEVEALSSVVGEFAAAIRERRPPMTDGRAGLRVLKILEAATRSLDRDGETIALT